MHARSAATKRGRVALHLDNNVLLVHLEGCVTGPFHSFRIPSTESCQYNKAGQIDLCTGVKKTMICVLHAWILPKSISSRVSQNVPQMAPDQAFGGRIFFVPHLVDVAPQPRPPNAAPKH
jgi:hypothetical protein